MNTEGPRSRHIVKTKDGHTHIILFDHINNPTVRQAIAELSEKTKGQRVDVSTEIFTKNQSSTDNKPHLKNVLSAVIYLSSKTGRGLEECFEALKKASYSIDGALEILNKKGY